MFVHAIRIPITTEADDNQSFVLGHDRLVDVPACDEMGEYHGTHGVWFRGGLMVLCGYVIVEGNDLPTRRGLALASHQRQSQNHVIVQNVAPLLEIFSQLKENK